MSARGLGVISLLGLLAASPLRAAEIRGSFSLPLPAADLPSGVITVKIVGEGLGDVRANETVSLLLEGKQEARAQTRKTGADGRARFEGLDAQRRYTLAVNVATGEIRSAPFTLPASGGLRFLSPRGRPPSN